MEESESSMSPHILMLVSWDCFPPSRRAAASRLNSFAKYWGDLTRLTVISPQKGSAEGNYTRLFFPLTRRRFDFLRIPFLLPFLLKIIKSFRPEIIYVSFPVGWQLLEAYILKKILKCPLIVSVADLPEWSHPIDKGFLLRRAYNYIMRSISHYIIKKATFVTTVTDLTKEHLVKKLGLFSSRVYVIRNGSETLLFEKALKIRKKFDLVYSGVIDSSVRDPDKMLLFLSKLTEIIPSVKILYILRITENYAKIFEENIEKMGLKDRIQFENMGSPDVLPERLGQARLGFNSIIANCETCRGAIGAKDYEYLAAGLPIVGLLDPDFYIETKRLVADNNVGILDPDPESLARKTAELLKDPQRLQEMSKRAREVGMRFDRKKLAEECYYKVILPAWKKFNAKAAPSD